VWYFSSRFWDCSDSVVFFRNTPHCRNSPEIYSKNTTLSEQSQNLLEKYHTVGTVPKSTRKIPHCRNSPKIYSQYTTLSKQSRNLLEKYHTVGTVPKSEYILGLFRQCGIFRVDFGTVPTVWYFSSRFWDCSDSVVYCE
jgi:hypothetical protein